MSTTPDSVRANDGGQTRVKHKKGDGPTGKVIHQLTSKDDYRLTQLIDVQRDFIRNEKMDYDALIKFVKERLDLDVTQFNLSSRLKMFDITLAPRKRPSGYARDIARTKLREEMAAMSQQVGQLREEYARLLELVTSPDKLEASVKSLHAALLNFASRLRVLEKKAGVDNPPFNIGVV